MYIDSLQYGFGSAMMPRLETDKLFQLPDGSSRFDGPLKNAISFIERIQLKDEPLWALFVRQFRSNVDDWDHGWRCEYWGKMMRGAAWVYQCTHSEELLQVMTDTVRDLLSAQEADGRISSYSREVEFHGWDIWGRKYVLLGLQYYMEICRDEALREEILQALVRHTDYILAHIGPEDEGRIEINTATDHWGGLNSSSLLEPIVRMYTLTGEMRYLEFADYIVSRGGMIGANIFDLAYEGRLYPYQYPFTKAYEMMSCFEGLLEYYRVTGVEKYRVATENFARLVAQSDITLIGCAGCTHELFDHSSVRQLDVTEKGIIQETCVTVTWMKLCYQLLCLTGDSFFADRIEQSLYNALLGAVNSEQRKENKGLPFDSYSPLLPGVRGRQTGGYKEMENGTYYGCCACIGAAGLGLGGMQAVMQRRDGVVVNAYMPGSFRVEEDVALQVETAYPVCGKVKITVQTQEDAEFALYLRIPEWSKNTGLCVNGEKLDRLAPGSYKKVDRLWKNGDVIELALDMNARYVRPEEYGVSSENAPYTAICYGPLVLALDARLVGDVDKALPFGDLQLSFAKEDRVANIAAFDLALQNGETVRLIDYSSAGKTWNEQSRMAAWMPVQA